MEQDDLVQAVEEFRTEMAAHNVHHVVLDIGYFAIIWQVGKVLTAEVRRQDDERV